MRPRKDENVVRQQIVDEALKLFKIKGLKFSMDELSHNLSISKKTIYMIFNDKKDMFNYILNNIFDSIEEEKAKILKDKSLDTVEKLKRTLASMPEQYRNFNFEKLYLLKSKYPTVYENVEKRLESGWEDVIKLMEKGVKEKKIRKTNLVLFKFIYTSVIETFFQKNTLVIYDIPYDYALSEVVSIIMDGIVA
ncbi:MAG: TetR/AcrR family transcriptional regulator [Lachnospiraceae bacterium]|nr:TetR/AcrR family transcriptional regulator [Lachnospiraceae bacterium]